METKKLNFQVLKYNQAIMAPFGIYPYRMTGPCNEFYTSFGSYYIITFLMAFLVLSSILVSKNIENTALALEVSCTIIGEMQAAGMFMSIGLQLKNIRALHITLQDLIDKGRTLCCLEMICSPFFQFLLLLKFNFFFFI